MIHAPRAIVHLPEDSNFLDSANFDALLDALQKHLAKHLHVDVEIRPGDVCVLPLRYSRYHNRATAAVIVALEGDPVLEFLPDIHDRIKNIARDVLVDCAWIEDMASGGKKNIDIKFGDVWVVI